MTENELKDIMESAGMALWSSYCDVKMELEDANDRIELLEKVITNILSQIDQGGSDGKVFARDYCIQWARETLEKNKS